MDEITAYPLHGYLSTREGKIHYRKYLPSVVDDPAVNPGHENRNPKGICVFNHGINGHSGNGHRVPDSSNSEDGKGESEGSGNGSRYTNMALMAREYTAAGYALYALDMLGHGFSEGERFYIPNGDWKINLDHLEQFAKFVASEHDENLPLFLLGESYGACLTIHLARRWQDRPEDAPKGFKGIGITAPAIIGDLPPAPITFVLKNLLAPIFPRSTPFFMPHPVSPERIWKDENIRREQTSEEAAKFGLHAGGRKFRLGTALGLLNALASVREDSIPGLKVPFVVCHGTDDAPVPIASTEYLLEHAETDEKDRAVRIVEGAFHDLMAEPSSQETVEFMLEWLNSRLALESE